MHHLAVRHIAQCARFTQLKNPEIPASSGTNFYSPHYSFHSGVRLKLLRVFLNMPYIHTAVIIYKPLHYFSSIF